VVLRALRSTPDEAVVATVTDPELLRRVRALSGLPRWTTPVFVVAGALIGGGIGWVTQRGGLLAWVVVALGAVLFSVAMVALSDPMCRRRYERRRARTILAYRAEQEARR
jgi:uncharacterized protein with ACT and thioredoxin-like domain